MHGCSAREQTTHQCFARQVSRFFAALAYIWRCAELN
jgi:hypothetical protein